MCNLHGRFKQKRSSEIKANIQIPVMFISLVLFEYKPITEILTVSRSLRNVWNGSHASALSLRRLTIKIDGTDVTQQHSPIHRVHFVTNAHRTWTEVNVHAMECVGHGVHGVNHKLHLPFLLVTGVAAHLLQTCTNTYKTHILNKHVLLRAQHKMLHLENPLLQMQ